MSKTHVQYFNILIFNHFLWLVLTPVFCVTWYLMFLHIIKFKIILSVRSVRVLNRVILTVTFLWICGLWLNELSTDYTSPLFVECDRLKAPWLHCFALLAFTFLLKHLIWFKKWFSTRVSVILTPTPKQLSREFTDLRNAKYIFKRLNYDWVYKKTYWIQ